MNQKILDFLKKERVCSFSIVLPNGMPHAAAVHYSHEENPLRLFIQTSNKSVKFSPFLNGEIAKAAVVIGFSEKDWLTFQMRGDVRMVGGRKEIDVIQHIHYAKHPDAEKWKDDPETVFIEFMPTWWRFTDYNTTPETIIEGHE